MSLLAMSACLVPSNAWAQQPLRACSEAFTTWVKQSEDTLKTHPRRGAEAGAPPQEACIPSEKARKVLLQSLQDVRRRCDAMHPSSEDVIMNKALLDINADVTTTIPVCTAFSTQVSKGTSCLSVTFNEGAHWLSNANCAGQKVIAVVEIKLESGARRCRGHTVSKSAKLGTTKPNLNYECVQNSDDCSVPRVKEIFPNCSW